MRVRYAPFYGLLLVLLVACAIKPETFNERLAAGYTTVTGVRNATASLLAANKISAPDAANVQQQADNARTGLDLARQIHATNPSAGDAKLDAAVTALTALEAYLRTRTTGEGS